MDTVAGYCIKNTAQKNIWNYFFSMNFIGLLTFLENMTYFFVEKNDEFQCSVDFLTKN